MGEAASWLGQDEIDERISAKESELRTAKVGWFEPGTWSEHLQAFGYPLYQGRRGSRARKDSSYPSA
jgi:hypothetical protein